MARNSKETHPLAVVRKTISKRFPLSQLELSQLLDCSRIYIQQIETKKVPLTLSMAQKIDAVLGTSFQKHLEAGEDDVDYRIDEDDILSRFMHSQFFEIENFSYTGKGAFPMPLRMIYDNLHQDPKSESFHSFASRAGKELSAVFSGFVDDLNDAIDKLPIREADRSDAIAALLDSVSSGHPYFRAGHFLWLQALNNGLTYETIWAHRKWVMMLNASYGHDVNLGAFYDSERHPFHRIDGAPVETDPRDH